MWMYPMCSQSDSNFLPRQQAGKIRYQEILTHVKKALMISISSCVFQYKERKHEQICDSIFRVVWQDEIYRSYCTYSMYGGCMWCACQMICTVPVLTCLQRCLQPTLQISLSLVNQRHLSGPNPYSHIWLHLVCILNPFTSLYPAEIPSNILL